MGVGKLFSLKKVNLFDHIMTNKHCDYIEIDIFLDLINELKMKQKEACEICGISKQQFHNWKKKGRMPLSRYWAFQKAVVIFLQEQMIRKMVRIGVIEKDFLRELLAE